ncbi:MAG: hypothetical protein R3C28_10810 [Pirellulaceae bacterium]
MMTITDRTTFPIITIGLIVINVLVFFGLQGGGEQCKFHQRVFHRSRRDFDGQRHCDG